MEHTARIEVTFFKPRGLFKTAIVTHIGEDGKPKTTIFWLGRDQRRAMEHAALIIRTQARFAEHLYEQSALPDLLGVAAEKINDDRLYRALDELLPHKADLEKHLKNRLGELFHLTYDLLLYDVTSTYFEGQCAGNDQAKRGYSRDKRSANDASPSRPSTKPSCCTNLA